MASANNDSSTQPSPPPPEPRVGVGLFLTDPIHHPGKFLLGHRTGSLGSDTWALPGGHLEFGESFEACAAREAEEETGLRVSAEGLGFLTATNSVMVEEGEGEGMGNKHYVTVFMVGRVEGGQGEAERREPGKCLEWRWVGWREMVGWEDGVEGRRLFQPMRDLLRQREGVVPVLE